MTQTYRKSRNIVFLEGSLQIYARKTRKKRVNMSHINMYNCLLKGINKELLDKVLKYFAQQNNGKIVTTINDYSGKKYAEWDGRPIIGAVKTSAVPRGVGVIINNGGKPQFVGDSYNHEQAFDDLVLSIQNTYITLARLMYLSQAGYQIDSWEKNNICVVQGIKE